MANQTKETIEKRISVYKDRLKKIADGKKADAAKAGRGLTKKLKRAQRRLRAMLGKPHPRKIFKTILRPGAKQQPAAGQAKK
ncbi:MAG: hypothetical protein HYT87_05635 [Nitrospirae bacterium]|nr:hypothetical protein [Nitrospirota bacterium]